MRNDRLLDRVHLWPQERLDQGAEVHTLTGVLQKHTDSLEEV